MEKREWRVIIMACAVFLAIKVDSIFSDSNFENLIANKKWKEAIEYADNNIPTTSRNDNIWVKVAQANEALGLSEKALACYMVAWRLNPNNYDALLGSAKIYNKLDQPENALDKAQKALEQRFTAEASWEYARACIRLNRAAEAKKALEKVVETDPNNVIANRELGNIYYNDRQYDKAIPLLKIAVQKQPDAEMFFKIGKAYLETKERTSAIAFFQDALKQNPNMVEANLELARAYYGIGDYAAASEQYDKALSRGKLTAEDYYNRAMAKEKRNDPQAVDAYIEAISKMGSGKTVDHIHAREFVARAYLEKKNYASAISHLEFIAGADPKAQTVKDVYFMLADAYEGSKNMTQAISSLEKAIAVDDKNAEAYARLGGLYERSGMSDKARVIFEKLLQFGSNDPHVYFVLGEYYYKIKNFSKAREMYVKSNSLKTNALALQGIALCAYEMKMWDNARDAAESAVGLDPTLSQSREVLAQILIKDRNFSGAKVHLEKLSEQNPDKIELLVALASCYQALGEKDNLYRVDTKVASLDRRNVESRQRIARYALEKQDIKTAYTVYKELALLTPNDAVVFKNLFELAIKNNEKQAAIGFLKNYVSLNSQDAVAQRDLGDLLYEAKDLDGALEAYRKAVSIDPTIKGFYKRYAEIIVAKGQYQEMIKVGEAQIRAGEADVNTYTTLGMIYQKTNNPRRAVEMYQKALQLEPQNLDALVELASCQAAAGDINGAIISYEQAVMMNPKAISEYKKLGELYSLQGKKNQAMKAYKNYLDQRQDDPEIARQYGLYAFEQKNYNETVQYLEIARRSFATDFDVLMTMGKAFFYLGKTKESIDMLESLMSKNPKAANSPEIFGLLAQAYEKIGDLRSAASMYAQYSSQKGVYDSEAAYKAAFLQEKDNPTAAQRLYESNIVKYPRDYRNFLRLGILYSTQKTMLSKSETMLKKSTELADTSLSAWKELAKVYNALKKEDDELEACKRIIKFDPQNVEANKRAGLILMKKGKVSEGMIYLEVASTLSPNDPDVLASLAGGYIKTNREKEAVSLLEKARQLMPNDTEIRYRLFETYKKLGRTKEALAEMKQLVEMKRDINILLGYAEMLYAEKKYDEAAQIVEDIKASNPENLQALMLMANIHRARKKYEDAVEVYKEITNYIDANYVPALYERAEVYMLMSKPMWAETFYKRVLKVDPKHALSELGLAKLCKSRKDSACYFEHLEKARMLDPNNEAIKEEVAASKKYR